MRQTNVSFTNNQYYTCEYCYEKYIPVRRYAQKYCSNSCRSKAYHQRKKLEIVTVKPSKKKKQSKKKGKTKIEKMSLPGVGNAAAGSALAEALTKVLTPEHKLPATKGDLNALEAKIQRYHRIENWPANVEGKLPYFDMQMKEVVYLNF